MSYFHIGRKIFFDFLTTGYPLMVFSKIDFFGQKMMGNAAIKLKFAA
jgi:hypothetical protein